ncbi:MAG TPA: hypothetical protein VIL48_06220 [Acidimicrobiales bacterium]
MSAVTEALGPVGPSVATRVDAGGLGARDAAETYDRIARLVAAGSVVAVGVDQRVGAGATPALPVALVLVPLWLPMLRRYALATLLAGLAALSAVSGVVLSELSSTDHVVSGPNRLQAIGLLASGIAAFGLLLWAASLLPLHRVALLYGLGGLASTVVQGEMSWKYNLAVPTTFVVLGLVERRRTGVVPAVTVFVLGVLAVADEARSLFAVCVLAATLTVWQLRPLAGARRQPGSPRHRWFPVALLAGLGVAVYFFISALATGGTLGETLQERSSTQITSSGSLIAGGRPEWAATRELFRLEPAGYGAGVVPTWTDRIAGETGLASINVDAGGYADNYMFGNTFELHSVIADLWVRFGWVGVALGVVIVVVILRGVSFLLAERQAPTYLLFGCILALWYVLFGPMYSNWLDVCGALGLAAVGAGPRSGEAVAPGVGVAAPGPGLRPEAPSEPPSEPLFEPASEPSSVSAPSPGSGSTPA